LFTVTFERTEETRHLSLFRRPYQLVLWCEHPGHWHPVSEASYKLSRPREWLVKIGPYMTLLFKALRLVVPTAAAMAGALLPTDQLERAQKELELMSTVVVDFSDSGLTPNTDLGVDETGNVLTLAEGQALRAARVLLFEIDHTRSFGGMQRVQTASGDFLWVCEAHYREYDPGLPGVP
jgi:internalin A